MQVTHRGIAALLTAVLITAGASCGSDSESEASTAPTTAVSGGSASTTATGESTDDTTDGTTDGTTVDSTGATTGSSAGGDDREKIVEFTVSSAGGAGLELDRDCVIGVVDQLSDDDAAQLAASQAGDAPEAALSPEGEALGETLVDCIVGSDDEALIAQVVDKLLIEGGSGVDEECVRTNVAKLNDEQLHLVLDAETGSTGPESTDPQLQSAAFLLRDCGELDPTATTG